MTATASPDVVTTGISSLEFGRRFLLGLIESFPAEKLTTQPFPGANHVLWNLGHIAVSDNYFLTSIGGQTSGVPEGYDELFGMGSTPVDEPSKYPSFDNLKAVLAERREAVIEWFRGMDDAQLAEPLPDELKGFAPTYGALMGSLSCHEGMHIGGICMIRKALGLERVMA